MWTVHHIKTKTPEMYWVLSEKISCVLLDFFLALQATLGDVNAAIDRLLQQRWP